METERVKNLTVTKKKKLAKEKRASKEQGKLLIGKKNKNIISLRDKELYCIVTIMTLDRSIICGDLIKSVNDDRSNIVIFDLS